MESPQFHSGNRAAMPVTLNVKSADPTRVLRESTANRIPVPAGLQELSGPLHALIEFLEIDEDLVEVAAQTSKPLAAGPSRRELSAWIRHLPESDKNDLLITPPVDQDERWRNDLLRRFRRTSLQQTSDVPAASERRKAGDLLAAAHARAKERARLLNEHRAAEAAKRRAEDEANRARYLDQLGRRQPEIWKLIAAHIETRQPKDYDRAVSLLTDLHDLAVRRGQTVKRRWRRSGKCTLSRRPSCVDLAWQTCSYKKVGRDRGNRGDWRSGRSNYGRLRSTRSLLSAYAFRGQRIQGECSAV
jgi:hypothetical protein